MLRDRGEKKSYFHIGHLQILTSLPKQPAGFYIWRLQVVALSIQFLNFAYTHRRDRIQCTYAILAKTGSFHLLIFEESEANAPGRKVFCTRSQSKVVEEVESEPQPSGSLCPFLRVNPAILT